MKRDVLMLIFVSLSSTAMAQVDDARGVIDLIESLQHDIKDFSCEYEGKHYYLNPIVQKDRGLKTEGLYDTFSGIYVWRAGGDTFVDTLHRHEPDGKITRNTLIVRAREGQAEVYTRAFDAPLGRASIQDSKSVNANGGGSIGKLFLIDALKRIAVDNERELSVSDGELDGRPLKVLTDRFKGLDLVLQRFWVDLKRCGHVVRRESYGAKGDFIGRLDIKLAAFKIGEAEVWMPVSGKSESHAAIDKAGKPYSSAEPTSSETIGIIDGTLQFNINPGPETFRHTYKPGTPISDSLRRVQTEFGTQKAPPTLSKVEIERMLREQVAAAEAQKAILSAAPSTGLGGELAAWLPGVFAVALIAGSGALLWQNRRRRGG